MLSVPPLGVVSGLCHVKSKAPALQELLNVPATAAAVPSVVAGTLFVRLFSYRIPEIFIDSKDTVFFIIKAFYRQ
jgi:hypothetical protein